MAAPGRYEPTLQVDRRGDVDVRVQRDGRGAGTFGHAAGNGSAQAGNRDHLPYRNVRSTAAWRRPFLGRSPDIVLCHPSTRACPLNGFEVDTEFSCQASGARCNDLPAACAARCGRGGRGAAGQAWEL